MIRTLIDLLSFINSLSGFLVALVFWTIVAVTFAKGIKKHARTLYWIFGVAAFLTLRPLWHLFGVEFADVVYFPLLGDLFIEYTFAAYFLHPVLVIIMYMGALSPKIPAVGKLMSIRKELSILVGFPVISHALKAIMLTLPSAWSFFVDHSELVARDKVVSELGQSVSNGVYVMGVLMTILFLVLWVTSFGGVRKRMGQRRWKRLQRWSYALYAMLFLHAVGINAGSLVTYLDAQKKKERTERVEAAKPSEGAEGKPSPAADSKAERKGGGSFLGMSMKVEAPQKGGHNFTGKFRFSNVLFSTPFKRGFNLAVLLAVYGSYLFLRLRKARRDRERKRR